MMIRSDTSASNDFEVRDSANIQWTQNFAAELVDHNMLLATSDKYGQVLEGSYIVLEDFCRGMEIFDSSNQAPRDPDDFLSPTSDIFELRHDHPRGIQQKYKWTPPESTFEPLVLLLLSRSQYGSSYNCLILKWKTAGECLERVGCCILQAINALRNNDFSGWKRKKLKLV
jgi:hypothetical protein